MTVNIEDRAAVRIDVLNDIYRPAMAAFAAAKMRGVTLMPFPEDGQVHAEAPDGHYFRMSENECQIIIVGALHHGGNSFYRELFAPLGFRYQRAHKLPTVIQAAVGRFTSIEYTARNPSRYGHFLLDHRPSGQKR